jgi:hypothetical protein
MSKISIFVFLSAIVIQGCKKENKISRNLEGTWTITEINTRKGFVNDFSTEIRTFKFLSYKRAYTRTMRGIYRVDYYDSRLPIIDTFEYQLKDDKIEITKVQPAKTVNGISVTNFALLRRRFLLSGSATDKITLTRLDTTGFYIRAIKQ